MKAMPEIGKTYNCFDDGKISYGRLYTVYVVDVIPFKDVDNETLDRWRELVVECSSLFADETDFFVKTTDGENGGNTFFVRTTDGGWFSIGEFMDSGRLDVDGELTNILNNKFN